MFYRNVSIITTPKLLCIVNEIFINLEIESWTIIENNHIFIYSWWYRFVGPITSYSSDVGTELRRTEYNIPLKFKF